MTYATKDDIQEIITIDPFNLSCSLENGYMVLECRNEESLENVQNIIQEKGFANVVARIGKKQILFN